MVKMLYWVRIKTTSVEESHTLQNYGNSLKEPRIIWIMLVQSYELEFSKGGKRHKRN